MKPAVFDYHRPSTVPEALAVLQRYAGGARVLAGGQSLMPMLNMRLWKPDALVDINDIDVLDQIDVDGDSTVLGAMVRYTTIERSALVRERLPLLAEVVTHIGDRQVRNRGTIGGSLVQADPTGEMALACLALDATVLVAGATGSREVPISELYVGSYATTLDPQELLIGIRFPRPPQHHAFGEINRKHNDFAVVSVAALGDVDGSGRWSDVRLALGGVHDTVIRARAAEQLLEGGSLADDSIRAAVESVLTELDPPSDIRGSAEYRSHLAGIQVTRVLRQLRLTATDREG